MYEEIPTDLYLETKLRKTSSSALKRRIEKNEREAMYDIKSNFQKGLAKLNDENTKHIGFREIQNIVMENRSYKWLRLYISLLSDKVTKTSRTEVILMFGFLAQIYQEDLLDPLDKPPNLIRTVVRICEEIYGYFKTNVTLVGEACSTSLIEIFKYWILDKDNKLLISSIFYKPLAGFIASGGDKIAQSTASFVLNKFINFILDEDYFDLANFFAPKIVALYIKSSWNDYWLTDLMTLILNQLGVKYYISVLTDLEEFEVGESKYQRTSSIVSKQIEILESKDKQNYRDKIASWKFLSSLAKRLQTVPDLLIGYYGDIIELLDDAVSDRVLSVQQAAREAKDSWLEFEDVYKAIEEKKWWIDEEIAILSFEEILHIRTGFEDTTNERVTHMLHNKIKNLYVSSPKFSTKSLGVQGMKISFGLEDKKYEIPRKVYEKEKFDIDDSNWQNKTKSTNYLKWREGVGGGHIPGKEIGYRSPKRKYYDPIYY